jgi:hypothetical protein
MPQSIPDPNNNNANVFTCQACPLSGCTNCYMNSTSSTCTECEVGFVLVND